MRFIRDIIEEKKREMSNGEVHQPARATSLDQGEGRFRTGINGVSTAGAERVTPRFHSLGTETDNNEETRELSVSGGSTAFDEAAATDCFQLKGDFSDDEETDESSDTLVLGEEHKAVSEESEDMTPRLEEDLEEEHDASAEAPTDDAVTVEEQSEGAAEAEVPEDVSEAVQEPEVTENPELAAEDFEESDSQVAASLPEEIAESAAPLTDEPASAEAEKNEALDLPEKPEEALADNVASFMTPVSETVDEDAKLEADAPVTVPRPAAGRASGRTGRVKTRLLGFAGPDTAGSDPFGRPSASENAAYSNFPVGWLAVVEGPGRGATFTLFAGVTQIGRGENQTIRLDFGDNSISRENHAAIAYDSETQKFYLGHGGKANLVRLNNRPVLSTEELQSESRIRIGETILRFIALCGPEFSWDEGQKAEVKHAYRG